MNKIFLAFLVVALVISASSQNEIGINLSKIYLDANQEAYQLSCSGANGDVKFTVEGLPKGVNFEGDRILVGGNTESGNHVLKISARDASGRVATRIVNLGVVVTQSSSSDSWSSSTSSGSSSSSTGLSWPNSGSGASGNSGTSINIGSTSGSTNTGSGAGTGSTTGGNPSGSSPGVSGVSSTSRLNQIITTYSSITDVSTPSYTENRYPQVNFPSGTTPSVNPSLTIISGSQSQPSETNRNIITDSDVRLRAASERHQTAIKSITNLVTIIDQARANKDQAERDITTYTNRYNAAVTTQRNAQQTIYNMQIRISQISSAINNINDQIGQLSTQTGNIKTEWSALIARRNQLQSQLGPYTNQKNDLLKQIDGLNQQISAYRNQLATNQVSCEATYQKIRDNKATLASLQNRINTIDSTINSLTLQYNQKNAIVDDLQRRLNDAIADRDSTKLRLNQANSDRQSIPAQITQLSQSISQYQGSYTNCLQQSSNLQRFIDDLLSQVNGLEGQIKDIDGKISIIQQQINTLVVQITQIETQTPANEGKLSELRNTLQFLRQQYTKAENQRNRLYSAGNDANNGVAYARQNLEAIIARYKSESATVSSATLNLQKARSEEAIAKLAMEELIQYYTNSLPYAIVPNGNGQGAGTPYGNNPSGSALGTISTNGNGAPGSFTISSWTNYLSQAYGAGVNPAFSGSVTELYPFSFSSVVSGNNLMNNIRGASGGVISSCGGSQPVVSTTGVVSAVRDTSFDITTSNGSVSTVNVAPCTTLNSNRANYIISSGDVAVVKGTQQSSNVYNSQSVTCLSTK